MEEPRISTESMHRVLKGVAVATKAHESVVQQLSDLISLQDPRNGPDANLDPDSTKEDAVSKPPTFHEWGEAFETAPSLQPDDPIIPLMQTVLGVALLREKLLAGSSASSTELNTIWSLIHRAITTTTTTTSSPSSSASLHFGVSRSAQGCLAVTLCSLVSDGKIEELWRLHVWMPDHERGLDAVSVHSHQCFGRSWILAGAGTDVIWDSEDVPACSSSSDTASSPPSATHAKYALAWTAADGGATGAKFQTHQKSSTIRNTGKLVKLQLRSRRTHSRDMSYSIPCNTYHESVVPGNKLHATLFVFDSSRGYEAGAAVLGPKGGTEFTQVRETPGITAGKLAEIVEASRLVEAGKWVGNLRDSL